MTNGPNLWEKRWNPLRGEWIVYAAHRNVRPWEGESVEKSRTPLSYDMSCYLCPGNTRANGKTNPKYKGVYVFENDFPVVSQSAPDINPLTNHLFKTEPAKGFAKVICYSPFHHLTMSDLNLDHLTDILKAWQKVTEEARSTGQESAFIFENKGEVTGVSNLHPHCQVYATDFVFTHTQVELNNANSYAGSLFQDIIDEELHDGRRIILENDSAVAFIPFFAKYTYEVMLFPKAKAATLLELSQADLKGIAQLLHDLFKKFDGLYQMSFPYVMSIMQAPLQKEYPEYQMYFHFQPPLRTPNIKKHLAGPEIGGGNFMADTIPEISAKILRNAH